MNWLVTGGCGFIGTQLVRRLLTEPSPPNIRVADDFAVGQPEDLASVAALVQRPAADLAGAPRGVELVAGDVRDYEAMEACLAGIDVVVHLAAHTGVLPSLDDPLGDAAVNISGTVNVLECARRRGARRFVFASSGAALGETEQPIREDRLPRPASPYGASKLAGEAYCSAYHQGFGLEAAALRFSNVYGPGSKRKESVVPRFLKRALAGEPLEVNGTGEQVRDFIYVDDLVDAVLLAALTEAEVGGEVFQVATQVETSINTLAQTVCEVVAAETGRTVAIRHVPAPPGDLPRVFADISKARRVLGFEPKVPLKEGVRKTLGDFAAQARAAELVT
jgi:UDP-glucose 4-epimerase